MPEHDDAPLFLRDVRALADAGLDPGAGPATQERARRTIADAIDPVRRVAAPRRLRWLSRRGAVLLGVGVALAGGSALAATTPWSPTNGGDPVGHPSTATTPVPADQLAAVAALRRDQTDEDRSPAVEAVLRRLPAEAADGVRLGSVRLLQRREDGISVLVSIERTGTNIDGSDPGWPREVEHERLCLLWTTHYVMLRGARTRMPQPSGGVKCGTAADVVAGRVTSGTSWGGWVAATGVVPDGVARVEIPVRAGQPVEVPVEGNAYWVDQEDPDRAANVSGAKWFDAEGREVRRQ
ncbi:hypothetical protein AB0L40_17030 [Patulibacter sp. NPDC049589]|uniref:hypothetical protein n=1 Tax=Patulibacter sp. NPDC049589 TaxID=3154731 RepID=UPI003413189A